MTNVERLLFSGPPFLTNGGTETYLSFEHGFPLREEAAFEIFDHAEAWSKLESRYVHPILDASHRHGLGVLLDALVWRAHEDCVRALGHSDRDVERFNRAAVRSLRASILRWRGSAPGRGDHPVLLSADVGPRGDGYRLAGRSITPREAHEYHQRQADVLADAGVDVLSAITMTSVPETIGIVRAAGVAGLAVIVSPTVETDGHVPDGTTLADFIARVDTETGGAPLFYMVNCAHPSHLEPTLREARAKEAPWLRRFRGFRANASCKSHEELDQSTSLDRGDPRTLATEVASLQAAYDLRVVGGCCGTDAEHIAAMAAAIRDDRNEMPKDLVR